jgi:uncharacterized protein (DUF1330 family)
MKTHYAIALAIVSAIGGAAAVQGLHAQGKPIVYAVTEIDVTNPEGFGKEFAPLAQASNKAAGGRQLAIGGVGGAGAAPVTTLEGTPPKRVVIQAWDSLDQLKAWFNGAAYQEARKVGNKYATFRRFAVEGQAN